MQKVQEKASNAAVHIQHQIGCFGQRVLLHTQCVLQVLGAREELVCIILQQLHALVLVVLQDAASHLLRCRPEWFASGPCSGKSTLLLACLAAC